MWVLKNWLGSFSRPVTLWAGHVHRQYPPTCAPAVDLGEFWCWRSCSPVGLKLRHAPEPSKGLDKTQTAKAHLHSFRFRRSGVETENLHSNKFLVMLMLRVWKPHFENHCSHPITSFERSTDPGPEKGNYFLSGPVPSGSHPSAWWTLSFMSWIVFHLPKFTCWSPNFTALECDLI